MGLLDAVNDEDRDGVHLLPRTVGARQMHLDVCILGINFQMCWPFLHTSPQRNMRFGEIALHSCINLQLRLLCRVPADPALLLMPAGERRRLTLDACRLLLQYKNNDVNLPRLC